jgi:hypothetical protein
MRAAAFLFATPSLAVAQPQSAKPSAEVKKLGYYIGTWEGHGETKAGPLGRAGKLSSKMTCNWFPGGFQVVCKGEETGPSGNRAFLDILAYDEQTKAFTEYSVSSFGETEYDQGGSLVNGKLTYVVHQNSGGKAATFRYSEDHLSPSLMTYQADVSIDGKPATVLATGKIKRIK